MGSFILSRGIPLLLLFGGGAAAGYTVWQFAPLPDRGSESTVGSDTSATADGVDDFGACNVDARAYCSGFYSDDWETWAEEHGYVSASWKLGLVDCLEQNGDLTSTECDASLDRRAELNEEMVEACAVDRSEHCRGVVPSPGNEPMVDCLKDNYDDLSAECAAAVDAHEAAKPTE